MLTGCLVWFIPSQTPTRPLNTKCSPFKNKEPRQTQTDTRIFWRVDAETVRVFWKWWVCFHSQAWTTITQPPWLFLKIETTKLCLHSAPPNHSACVLELKVHFPSQRVFFFFRAILRISFPQQISGRGRSLRLRCVTCFPGATRVNRSEQSDIAFEFQIEKNTRPATWKLRVFGRWIKDKWSEKLRTTLLLFFYPVSHLFRLFPLRALVILECDSHLIWQPTIETWAPVHTQMSHNKHKVCLCSQWKGRHFFGALWTAAA